MRDALKRLLSILLALILALSVFPAALAADLDTDKSTEIPAEESMEPEEPAGSEEVEDPAEPEEPAEPEDPADPEEPEDPADPPVGEGLAPPAEPEEPEAETAELPCGFAGMGEGYVFSQAELDAKARLAGVPEALAGMREGADYTAGELLLTTDSAEYAQAAADAYNAVLVRFTGHFAKLRLTGATVAEAVAAAADMDLPLPAVEPNYIVWMEPVLRGGDDSELAAWAEADIPTRLTWQDWVTDLGLDDPYLVNPSGHELVGRDMYSRNVFEETGYQYMHDMTGTYAAWGVTTGNSAVTVAVLDSGADTGHEDLAGVRWTAPYNAVRYELYDEDAQVIGWGDEWGGPYDPSDVTDYHGHGTHCIGIVAAQMKNGAGGAGIAPGVSVMPVRVLGADNYGTTEWIVDGIYYAADGGADILSMSFCGRPAEGIENDAVQYAYAHGVTLIAALGNDGSNLKSYPAAYDHVIGVAAVNRAGLRAAFSSYGAWADVAAPGTGMLSTVPASVYGYSYEAWNGTSMATPVVAGVAALYMSAYGNPGPAAMEKILKASVTKSGSSGVGTGIINAEKMFSSNKTAPATKLSDPGTGSEKQNKTSYTSSRQGVLSVMPGDASLAEGEGMAASRFIYTDNGKTPSVLNGKVVSGRTADAPEGTFAIFLDEYPVGKTVTFKIRQIFGTGAASNVTTVKVKIVNSTQDEILSGIQVKVLAPAKLVGGKSAVLTAVVTSAYTVSVWDEELEDFVEETVEDYAGVSQAVTWSLGENSAGAKIDTKTGKLTAPAGASGTVTVTATSKANPAKSDSAVVAVEAAAPVSAVELTAPALELNAGNEMKLGLRLTDAAGNEVDPETAEIRFTSSGEKVAVVREAPDGSPVIAALSAGTATITAAVQDGSGAKGTLKVTVRQPAAGLSITGDTVIAPGRSATYKAVIEPADASVKAVNWTVHAYDEDFNEVGGVTVDEKGKVTVGWTVLYGTKIGLTAETTDGTEIAATFDISVAARADSVHINADGALMLDFSYNKKAPFNLQSITIFTQDIPQTWGTAYINYMPTPVEITDDQVQLYASRVLYDGYNDYEGIAWSSNKPEIATVDEEGLVTAQGEGTATITAKAMDGSGKKATVKIKVVVPASSLEIVSKTQGETRYITYGKGQKNSAALGSAYGKPTVSKVNWSFSTSDYSRDTLLAKKKLVTINSSGTLTVKKGARKYLQPGTPIVITAQTTDGTKLEDKAVYILIDPVKTLSLRDFDYTGELVDEVLEIEVLDARKTLALQRQGYPGTRDLIILDNTGGKADYTCKSGSPNVAGATVLKQRFVIDGEIRQVSVLRVYAGEKAGSAKITVTACDGSGKKITLTVKVL